MTTITIKQINKVASDVKKSVDKDKKLPVLSGWSYPQYGLLLAQSVVKPNKSIEKTPKANVDYPPEPSGTDISRTIYKKDYIKLAQYVIDFVKRNKRLPNYVQWNNYKIVCKLYIYCFAKIVDYYAEHKALPNYCNFNSKDFSKEKTGSTNEFYNYFVKVFGKVSTIDGALAKVKDRGYGYYYDDKYGNKEAVDRIKKGWGINCTDSCQLFWHIAKALGYDVQCIHVRCSGGDGHVRLKLRHKKHSNNEWFLRDPAAVLAANGQPVSYNWCTSGYTLLATNPNWFLANLNR